MKNLEYEYLNKAIRGSDKMKTQNGFTLMNKNEIGSYLAKQNVIQMSKTYDRKRQL